MNIQINDGLVEDTSLAESIIDQIADAIIYADTTGTIRRWNHAAAALFGYSVAEALGQKLDLIIPERLRAAHWRGFESAIANRVMSLQGRPTLTRAMHQSGRKLYIEMTFALVKEQAGAVCGAVAVARDATERVEQQRADAHGKNSANELSRAEHGPRNDPKKTNSEILP